MLVAIALAGSLQILPVEQCGRDPAFTAVRAQFAAAVAKRDVTKLVALAAPDVTIDDGGDMRGAERLRSEMTGELGPDLWRELEPVGVGGCSEREGVRTLPSLRSQLEGENSVVAAVREPIRAGPSVRARVKRYVSWARVAKNYGDSGPEYWRVRLTSGLSGYVRSERVYSSSSPYAVFERRDGKWLLTVLRLFPAD